MTEQNQKRLGKTLWNIADQLRGAMNADDFRDYMLAFLFLRYLSDNYEAAAKRELGGTIPTRTWWATSDDRNSRQCCRRRRSDSMPVFGLQSRDSGELTQVVSDDR